MSGVVSTWSRRRAAVAAEAAAEQQATVDAFALEDAAATEEKSDTEILQELGLPDPMTLVQGDDFKAFMSKAVPAHLRKIALRKLWTSNPVLACLDGLNDYDDDYLTGSTGQGAIKTTYQVGKGMLAHLLEVERQKNTAEIEDVAVEDHDRELDDDVEIEVEMAASPAMESDAEAGIQADDLVAAAPRRMQFQFEDGTA